MRIYLASRFSRQREMRAIRDRIVAMGHEVNSRWLEEEYESSGHGSSQAPPEHHEKWAKYNYQDVLLCDTMVNFTEPPNSCGRGGRHVELGLALAWGKRLIVVGHRENVFHNLPQVEF